MRYEIVYSERSMEDLADIYEYIAFSLMDPWAAGRVYSGIVNAVDTLKSFPFRNSLAEDEPWKGMGLRKLPVKNYLIFYTTDLESCAVKIIRIMYGARDIEKQLQ